MYKDFFESALVSPADVCQVGLPSGLRASTAEVVSSACAKRPARAQGRANARPVQSICPDCEALTSPALSNGAILGIDILEAYGRAAGTKAAHVAPPPQASLGTP